MPLSDIDYAYNELIDAINARDAQLDKLIEERDRLWHSCQAIYAVSVPLRRQIVESKK